MRERQGLGAVVLAQARVALGVLAGYEPPIVRGALDAVLGRVRVQEVVVAGVPATLFRPGRGGGPWPAVLVVPGITRRGRAHPAFQGIGRALAATGHLAVVAEPGAVAVGEVHPTVVAAAARVATIIASLPEARGGTVALAGVSGGGTVALLLAAEPELVPRVSGVAVLAPACDIELAIRVGTTGTYRAGTETREFAAGSFATLVVARSVVASLPEGPDRDVLRSYLLALADDDPDPTAALRAWPRDGLAQQTCCALDLLSNRDPARFDELYARLGDEQRTAVETLSPTRVANRIESPVELVVGRSDKYLPRADAATFVASCSSARLTVIESLEHAVPRLGPSELRSLGQLDAVLVRSLAAARRRP